MKLYLITYDLKKPDRDYSGLFNVLKSYPSWWHHLESTWLIPTEENADTIFEKIKPHIDENDSVLIIQVNKDKQGWLTERAWNWIKKQLAK